MQNNVYDNWTDRQLVDAVTAVPHNDEAGAYLIYVRYSPLLKTIFRDFSFDWYLYDDCVSELFLYMRGKDGNWRWLAGFEWRSSFGTWFRHVAYTQFPKIYFRLIENGDMIVSMDEESNDMVSVINAIPSDDNVESEQALQRVILLEAIMQMKNQNDQFIVLKYLKGYSGKEIAQMLSARWKETGEVHKDKNGQPAKPTEKYVNVRIQRIKNDLRMAVQKML